MVQIIDVRHSEVATFRQCPLLHQWVWKELWAKPEESVASNTGTAWHLIAGTHYQAIQEFQHATGKLALSRVAMQDVLDRVDATIETRIAEELQETIDWMYDGLIERYGFDESHEILSVEQFKQVLWPNQDGDRIFRYSWTSDRVIRDYATKNKQIFVVDEKSTANPLRQVDVDLMDQIGMYVWAERMDGVAALAPMIRQVQTKKLKRAQTLEERYAELYSMRTDIELENIANEILGIAHHMHSGLPPYSSPDPRICSWKCDFREIHLAVRKTKNPARALPAMLRSRGYIQREAVPSGHDQF
jgi:hypothetical protein